MPVRRTPRKRWVEEGLRALAAGGPDAVRVESLARSLGVTKGGFYWHFDDRLALLDEMLDRWERTAVDEVIDRVEDSGGDEQAKLRRLFAIAGDDPAEQILEIDLAVRDWARRDPKVAKRLRRADSRRMGYMRELFGAFSENEEDTEARAMLAFSLWIGNHFIAAEHGPRSRRNVMQLASARLLSR